MKALLFLAFILCLTGCASPPGPISIEKIPTYGDALPGTIHVIAHQGFERPGHYYLPEGATLGLLIDLAELKPIGPRFLNVNWCWNFLDVGPLQASKPRLRIDRDNGVVSKRDRKERLRNGERVRRNSISL